MCEFISSLLERHRLEVVLKMLFWVQRFPAHTGFLYFLRGLEHVLKPAESQATMKQASLGNRASTRELCSWLS